MSSKYSELFPGDLLLLKQDCYFREIDIYEDSVIKRKFLLFHKNDLILIISRIDNQKFLHFESNRNSYFNVLAQNMIYTIMIYTQDFYEDYMTKI